MGVVALSVPASDELSLLPTTPKIIAGIKYPNKPENKRGAALGFGKFLRSFNAHGNKARPAIKIRPAPSSRAEKCETIFLTKIKDNPQTNARNKIKIQPNKVLSSWFLSFFIKILI